MSEWVWIAGMALVTFAVRYPVLLLVGRMPLPQPVLRALKFVPAAVLTAIVAPAILFDSNGRIALDYTNAFLVAGVVSAGVAWRSRNLLLTIVAGMASLWAWRWVLTLIVQ
jgi:branched-subunit amino acid transport protein